MKMGLRFFLAASLLLPGVALAGPGTTGGGDRPLPQTGSAWFLGKGLPIRACVQVADGFGVSQSFATNALIQAFTTWRNYLISKGLGGYHVPNHDDPLETIATDLTVSPACDGGEDLTLYLGMTQSESINAQIETAAKQFDRPIAFAQRTSYDLDAGWGKGFIWVSPSDSNKAVEPIGSWAAPYALQFVLLHEVGHVFGCEHSFQTVMDENLYRNLAGSWNSDGTPHEPDAWDVYFLTHIDGARELAPSHQGPVEYPGVNGSNPNWPSAQLDPQTFRRFVGRLPKGKAKITARVSFSFTVPATVTVIYADSQGSVELPVKFEEGHTLGLNTFSTVKAFHTTRIIPYSGGIPISGTTKSLVDGYETSGEGFVTFGAVRDFHGNDVLVVVTSEVAPDGDTITGTDSEALSVLYQDGSAFKPLFLSTQRPL